MCQVKHNFYRPFFVITPKTILDRRPFGHHWGNSKFQNVTSVSNCSWSVTGIAPSVWNKYTYVFKTSHASKKD